jgi:hypothetical protein
VRAIVVSSQPALVLSLATQLQGCDAHPASSVDAVIDLTGDDAVVLLDLGSSEAAARWLEDLRGAGVDLGVVVVDDVPPDALDSATLHLPRPFSIEALSTAFASLTDAPPPTAIGAAGSGNAGDESEAPVALRADVPGEELRVEPAAEGTRPRVSGGGAGGAGETPGDAALVEPVASANAPDATGSGRPPPSSASPLASFARPSLAGGPEAPEKQRGRLSRRLRTTEGEQASDARSPSDPALTIQERVAAGLSASLTLEEVLAHVTVVTDVALCASVLLDEVAENLRVGAAAIAVRVLGVDLEVMAATGAQVGAGSGHLAPDHPFIRAVVRQGGGVLLAPTDSVRGLLAGVPVSHWPVLLAVTLPEGDEVEGLVLVGQPTPADPDELDRLAAIVTEGSDLLRLAASFARLPRPAIPEQRQPPRSWER